MPIFKSTFLILAICLGSLIIAGCSATETRESTSEYVDSTVITTKAKAALAADDMTSLLQIEVETFRDVVQLSGFVDNEEQKAQAGAIVQDIDGVETVENNLVVKPAS